MERDLKESKKSSPAEGNGKTPHLLPDKKDPLKTEKADSLNGSVNGEYRDHYTISKAVRLHIALKVMDTDARAKYFALVHHCEENGIDIDSAANGRFKDILDDQFAVMAEEMTPSDAPRDTVDREDPITRVRHALETITPTNTEKKANEIIRALIAMATDVAKHKSYKKEYLDKVPEADALGIAIATYFEWDTRIFQAFVKALEDANFHQEATDIFLRYPTRF